MSDKKREMILNNLALSMGLTKEQLVNSHDKNIQEMLSKIEKKARANATTLVIEGEQE